MPKLKIANRYWVIPNKLLNDPNISWKAKWLFWYLQSKPEDWDFAVSRICKEASDGEKATISWIKELEKAGYLQRNKYQNELWHWDIEYILFDIPIAENRQQENETIAENPHAENPVAENRQTNKTISTKKEIQSNKVYIEDDFLNWKILEFIENRKQLKKPMTDLAIQKMVTKCGIWKNKFSQDQISYFFDRAIEAGWQWLFEVFETKQWQPQKPVQAYQKPQAREEFAFTS